MSQLEVTSEVIVLVGGQVGSSPDHSLPASVGPRGGAGVKGVERAVVLTFCLCRYYESFTNCTELETNIVGCYWPNPLAQSFITDIHRQFFSNCTVDRTHWEDPPDEILIPLIAVPVVLTVAMAGLVVWRSKRTEQLM